MSHIYQDIKRARPDAPILPVIAERWSPRAYSEQPVDRAQLLQVFEAGRWAASSTNEQPWRFYLGLKGDEVWQAIFDSLDPFNQRWCAPVPVLILAAARSNFTRDESPNRHAMHDTGQALAFMALQATSLGLYAHMMGGFNVETARRLLNAPDHLTLCTVMALGHAGDPAALSESHAASEQTPRTRKPLSELVFGGAGETPFDWQG